MVVEIFNDVYDALACDLESSLCRAGAAITAIGIDMAMADERRRRHDEHRDADKDEDRDGHNGDDDPHFEQHELDDDHTER